MAVITFIFFIFGILVLLIPTNEMKDKNIMITTKIGFILLFASLLMAIILEIKK